MGCSLEQAFFLPVPKYCQTWNQFDSGYPSQMHLDPDEHLWPDLLEELSRHRIGWPQVLEHLRKSSDPHKHPLAKLSTAKEKQTLLHLAVLDEQSDCIELLVQEGSLLERRNGFGLTPLELAKFLYKKKSLSKLSPKVLSESFLGHAKVKVDREEKLDAHDLQYVSHPVFESSEILQEIMEYSLKAKGKNQISNHRIWMGIYFDDELNRDKHPLVSIRWIDEQIGFGVFAEDRIFSSSFIGEYTGLIQPRKKHHICESNFCFRYTAWQLGKKQYVIDAEQMGNFTRFINHSDNPNAALISAFWRGIPRLVFVALRDIPAGSQITFDYGETFWKQSRMKSVQLS